MRFNLHTVSATLELAVSINRQTDSHRQTGAQKAAGKLKTRNVALSVKSAKVNNCLSVVETYQRCRRCGLPTSRRRSEIHPSSGSSWTTRHWTHRSTGHNYDRSAEWSGCLKATWGRDSPTGQKDRDIPDNIHTEQTYTHSTCNTMTNIKKLQPDKFFMGKPA